MGALPLPTLDQAVSALRDGATSSRELCESVLGRIDTVDSRIGAYLYVDREEVLADAAAADRRRADGSQLGPFDGIPIAVKDNMAVRGQPLTCASRILKDFVSPYDATVIERLRSQGFIFLGRTNMDEFAMGSSNENSGLQATSNPHDSSRVPGGSSGGSAAAVAGGEAIVALGSDTGGSIRLPASFCGVVGVKPTYGRVSRYGLVAFASSLDQIGPLTRTVRDSALMLDIISGRDPRDSTSLPEPAGGCASCLSAASVNGMRCGMPREYFEVEGLDPSVRECVENAARQLEAEGAEIVEVSLPMLKYAIAAYYIIATAEASANLARFDGVRYGLRDSEGEAESLLAQYRLSRARGFGDEVKRRIILGTYVLSSGYYDAYYLRAQKVRTLIRKDFEHAFTECDVILSPVSPEPAYKKGELATPLRMYLADIYTISVNLAGICGLSVPCGATESGLPIGLQMLAPALHEKRLLQAAATYEAIRGDL
ncbi:MAG: Asp-tRNA(Asn)/Glu-tRNA(Gln) amidotransferase subunit GatA [Candidatus Pacebacteria bacterium]|nr:Asp-tRNA(Asn)/Glu-tRNA(Gln) amidotransferase subunit GatA [Candidatus Paceibacterota bacterium]